MEFEEMKKIWDEQDQQPLYAINEVALHNLIRAKKRTSHRILNSSEWLNILVNFGAGGAILIEYFNQGNIPMLILGTLMLAMGLFIFFGRIQRKGQVYDNNKTMLGDLGQALRDATFQVRISQILRWHVVPIAILVLWGLSADDPNRILFFALVAVFFAATFWASRWEHRYYVRRRDELTKLKKTLEETNL